jgi:hypothetical protein
VKIIDFVTHFSLSKKCVEIKKKGSILSSCKKYIICGTYLFIWIPRKPKPVRIVISPVSVWLLFRTEQKSLKNSTTCHATFKHKISGSCSWVSSHICDILSLPKSRRFQQASSITVAPYLIKVLFLKFCACSFLKLEIKKHLPNISDLFGYFFGGSYKCADVRTHFSDTMMPLPRTS